MHWLETLPAWPTLALLLLLANRLLTLPGARAPLAAVAVLLQRLATQVHPDIQRSAFQQQLSGGLALLLVLVVVLAMVIGLYLISELPLILDAVLLYFCLGGQQLFQPARNIAGSLNRQQLSLARSQAKSLLLRDRQNLSAMGLSKACTESLLLQQAANQVAVLCWFLLGGGVLALAYTLLQTAARQWNSKLPHYRYFGRAAALAYQLVLLPGVLISALLLAVQDGMLAAWRTFRATDQQFFSWPTRLLLATAASALHTTLGGPAYYGKFKTARPRIGRGQDPDAKVLLRAIVLIKAQQTALILLLSSIVALYVASSLLQN
ncbi:hypothetical protein WG68_14125 [Arsukibacterium ikkense]|uniref:Cobalamin biosynthesis protein CbiB n=1 Tax=Arsukibacterium ikkense TaxID=336831 RepID=A0A0M2V689_9GAMM|nr:cobalamin biosynthesis protein [Arsukibacterium ikkense]KKO44683.1 hypothetical protein WG68_14125 [Arsukibacterium ikkense]